MDKLVSLKGSNDACCPEQNAYPWGTELRLKDDVVEQLGVADLPAGTAVQITAVGFVRARDERVNDGEGGEVDVDMCLQVTDLSVAKASTAVDKAKTMYPSMMMMGEGE